MYRKKVSNIASAYSLQTAVIKDVGRSIEQLDFKMKDLNKWKSDLIDKTERNIFQDLVSLPQSDSTYGSLFRMSSSGKSVYFLSPEEEDAQPKHVFVKVITKNEVISVKDCIQIEVRYNDYVGDFRLSLYDFAYKSGELNCNDILVDDIEEISIEFIII